MKRRSLVLLLLCCLLLTGCGGKKNGAVPTPVTVVEPTLAPIVEEPAPAPETVPEPAEEPAPTPGPTPTPTPTPIRLFYNGTEVNSLTVKTDSTLIITSDADASNGLVSYASDNEAVARIDAAGKISALSEGNATITASQGDRSGSCKITVAKPVKPTVTICFWNTPKYDITMNASNNETLQLQAVTTPTEAAEKAIWSSTDPAIADVSPDGLVTAISQGSCEVICQCGDGSARCWIRVKGQRINYQPVSADPNNTEPAIFITCNGFINPDFTIRVNESVNMDHKVVNAEDSGVTWTIANGAVASVDQNGVVTGLAKGTTTLTVSCGSLSYTSTVRVA